MTIERIIKRIAELRNDTYAKLHTRNRGDTFEYLLGYSVALGDVIEIIREEEKE